MTPNLGITDKNRSAIVAILNALLADEFLIYTKTRNYHWNVVGPQFNDLHKFFEAQYEALDDTVDDVAERVRTLGGRASGTLAEFVQQGRLKERPGDRPDAVACSPICWPTTRPSSVSSGSIWTPRPGRATPGRTISSPA